MVGREGDAVGSALVLGDVGSGLTTFVGLLYAAQLRLGTEERDEFRFSADRETIRALEGIYGELVAGRFPEGDVDWDAHPLSFVFGRRHGWLGGIGARARSSGEGFDAVDLEVGGISAREIAELADHNAILDESARRLLRSPVVLPLVDASRLDLDSQGTAPALLVHYDRSLARALSVLARFLGTAPRRSARRMAPLFIVTKFDLLPAGSRSTLGLPTAGIPPPDAGGRERIGQAILGRFLPETSRALATAADHGRLRVDPPRWFYSALATSPGPSGPRIARRSRVPVGGWEPEYPFEEYRALVGELGRLARRLPGSGRGS